MCFKRKFKMLEMRVPAMVHSGGSVCEPEPRCGCECEGDSGKLESQQKEKNMAAVSCAAVTSCACTCRLNTDTEDNVRGYLDTDSDRALDTDSDHALDNVHGYVDTGHQCTILAPSDYTCSTAGPHGTVSHTELFKLSHHISSFKRRRAKRSWNQSDGGVSRAAVRDKDAWRRVARTALCVMVLVCVVDVGVTAPSAQGGSSSGGPSRPSLPSRGEDGGPDPLARLSRVFGIRRIPRRVVDGVPPEYMTQLYGAVADTHGLTKAPGPYNANTVRSFPDRG